MTLQLQRFAHKNRSEVPIPVADNVLISNSQDRKLIPT
jgi:hypothetical protein